MIRGDHEHAFLMARVAASHAACAYRWGAKRLWLVFWLSMLGLGTGGCLIPIGSKVSDGHHYSKEALAFLELPGATRNEVIASLGEPLYESLETRTLVYVWYEKPRYVSVPLDGTETEVVSGSPVEWALFIALNEQGAVVAHEERYIGSRDLKAECAKWSLKRAAAR
jgi:hypothetical protein